MWWQWSVAAASKTKSRNLGCTFFERWPVPPPRELRSGQSTFANNDVAVALLALSHGNERIDAMFKPTPSLQKMLRRLPLSPKQAGKEYYKGNRVGSMGTINKYGNFTPDWSKIRTYVYPIHGTKNSEVRVRRWSALWPTGGQEIKTSGLTIGS